MKIDGTMTLGELKECSTKDNFDLIVSDLKVALQRDSTVERACRYAQINKDTYYAWYKASDEFAAAMDLAKDYLFNKSTENIKEALDAKDKDLSKWYLERRDKKRYAARNEITGDEGAPIVHGIRDLMNESKV
jgi:hypothetical protein